MAYLNCTTRGKIQSGHIEQNAKRKTEPFGRISRHCASILNPALPKTIRFWGKAVLIRFHFPSALSFSGLRPLRSIWKKRVFFLPFCARFGTVSALRWESVVKSGSFPPFCPTFPFSKFVKHFFRLYLKPILKVFNFWLFLLILSRFGIWIEKRGCRGYNAPTK